MRSSKEIYNYCFEEYTIDDQNLQKLHCVLFEMLRDFKKVCNKYGIKYMLSGGSVLGAVRHKGFIPWDDDIDIMITRREYERFAKVLSSEFPDKYLLVEPLSKNYFFKMPKMFLKNSKYTELALAGTPDYHMIFLDLFIIEYVPNNIVLRKVKGFIYDFAYKASSVCIDYLYPSQPIVDKMTTPELQDYYSVRRRLGAFFSHVGGIKLYLKIADKVARSTRKSGWMGIPSGISYDREVFRSTLFEEVTDAEFEGELFPIPKDYDLYLSNLYGNDYMSVPEKNKRQTHLAVELEFPD